MANGGGAASLSVFLFFLFPLRLSSSGFISQNRIDLADPSLDAGHELWFKRW
jgi:hypothetical protein